MKKTNIRILIITTIVFAIASCGRKEIESFVPTKNFTPTSVTVKTFDTAAVISWPASLFSSGSGVTYTVEISEDTTFQSAPTLTRIVDSIATTVYDDSLADRTKYFVRVKANATANSTESDWMAAEQSFTLVGVQIFQSVQSQDIIDNAVILRWTTTPGVDKIVITKPDNSTMEVAIADADNQAGYKMIKGLTGSTTYSAEIFAGTRSKGLVTFTTKTPISGSNIIDLRDITDRDQVLYDTLPQIASGSIVLLARGGVYTMPSSYVFDRSVSILSGLGFGDPATVLLSGNFDASGNIDSLVFSDITIATDGNSAYFMNVGNVADIQKLVVSNCTTKGVFNNSFIRLKTGDDVIHNLVIENSIIDSIGIASKYALLYANASSTAKIDNISISNSTFYSFYYFIRQDGVLGTSLNITNCTFNDMINNGGYFIRYSVAYPTTFNITNAIFGSTIDPTNSNGMSSTANAVLSGCYITSDCVFSANPIMGATSYNGTAANLFTNAAAGDFSIADAGFAGKGKAGDPRWW